MLHKSILSLLFREVCLVCEEGISEGVLCKDCQDKIVFIEGRVCDFCGHKLGEEIVCSACSHTKLHFDVARSVGVYSGVLRECIHLFKYQRYLSLAKFLANILVEYLNKQPWLIDEIDYITYVAMSNKKHRQRGFNHSKILSQNVAHALQLKLLPLLRKTKHTLDQASLPKEQRQKNIQGTFAPSNKKAIVGKKILIVDDVYTTGATLSECAYTLKSAGAAQVRALCLAKTIT